jgi:hypothetical protein
MGGMVQAALRTHAAPAVNGASASGDIPATSMLLAAPPAGAVGTEEAITMLLQMSSQMSEQQLRLGKAGIDVADKRREDAAARREEALDRAAEAARQAQEKQDDGGVFSFVTDNVGAVGLLGLCTFNWGLVAADIAAHKTELADDRTDFLDGGAAVFGGPLAYLAMEGARKLAPEEVTQTRVAGALLGGPMGYALVRAAEKLVPGEYEAMLEQNSAVKDEDVRLANKIALMVALAAVAAASVVLSGGTSTPAVVALVGIGISTGTQIAAETGLLEEVVGEKAAVYVALGGAITGAALTLGGSVWSLASAADTTAQVTAKAAAAKRIIAGLNGARGIAEGTHHAKQGFDALERAERRHDADLANVDAEEQKQVLARIEKIVESILEDLKEAHDAAQRSTETLQESLQTKNQTMLRAGAMKV